MILSLLCFVLVSDQEIYLELIGLFYLPVTNAWLYFKYGISIKIKSVTDIKMNSAWLWECPYFCCLGSVCDCLHHNTWKLRLESSRHGGAMTNLQHELTVAQWPPRTMTPWGIYRRNTRVCGPTGLPCYLLELSMIPSKFAELRDFDRRGRLRCGSACQQKWNTRERAAAS